MKITAFFAALVLALFPSLAFASDMAASSTSVDFSPLIITLLNYATPILTTVFGLIFTAITAPIMPYAVKYLGASTAANQRDSIDQLLSTSISWAVNSLRDRVTKGGAVYDVKSQLLAFAIEYANTHGPDMLNNMGITPDLLEQKILARFPTHPAISLCPVTIAAPASAGPPRAPQRSPRAARACPASSGCGRTAPGW